MLDLKAIREDPERFRDPLARRSEALAADLDRLLDADRRWRELTTRVEELRAEQNRGSKAVGEAPAEERDRLIGELRKVSEELRKLEPELTAAEEELHELASRLPNPPHESVPEGETDEENELVREVGTPPSFPFEPKDHVALGQALGVIDLERAARTSGTRFAYLVGGAVWVQWALVRYCLDVLTAKGFVPVVPPVLVREDAMYGTGFLPT
ncbi:MAG TPA: serine--tRNA ligase, partial [Actinomycetota bacterium]|nr:serine--tRNA ligase [Actinomycetota bacterium]